MAKRIQERRARNNTQRALDNYENNIKGRETSTFTGSANDPFNAPAKDNYQTYPYDYFSGADCKIFFGDIWVDDIITLQYNVNQDKTPIYGYASQLFDAVAKGQVIVQGSLSVSFKETGYLNLIQGIIESQKRNVKAVVRSKIAEHEFLGKQGMTKFIPRLNYIGEDPKPKEFGLEYSVNGAPQIIRQQQTIEQILTGKKAGTALAKTLGIEQGDRDFEDFAKVLEDTLWGDSDGEPLTLDNKLKRVDEFDYSSNGGIKTGKLRNYSDTLNIMLTFGDINDYRAEHTMIVLNDVHFVSTGMVVSPTGDPIAEMYNFFARDINDSISTELSTNANPIKLNVGNDEIKLSKLEDVKNIENFLNQNPNQVFSITFLAAFDKYGWNSYPGTLILDFVPNRILPFTDQLCLAVERAMNSITVPEIVDSSKDQYIIKVGSGGDSDITMIVEQSMPNTRTFKVISPTRSGFNSQSIITREDLFTDAKDIVPPLDIAKSRIDANKSALDASVGEALSEKAKIEKELSEVGTFDEQKSWIAAKDKLTDYTIKANEDKNISKFEQRKLDRLIGKVDERFIDLQEEKQGLSKEQREHNALVRKLDKEFIDINEDGSTSKREREKLERLSYKVYESEKELLEEKQGLSKELRDYNALVRKLEREVANIDDKPMSNIDKRRLERLSYQVADTERKLLEEAEGLSKEQREYNDLLARTEREITEADLDGNRSLFEQRRIARLSLKASDKFSELGVDGKQIEGA
jgi:hypothetical protein